MIKDKKRYARQMILKELGEPGMHKIRESKVLVVGAGGLGCPALLYLAAAGIGTLGIVDDDIVSISNLHRQILFQEPDVGKYKVDVALKTLKKYNHEVDINIYHTHLSNENAINILRQYDVVIDGTDNMTSRYIINDACLLLQKPFIYGAISRFEGHLAVFNVESSEGIFSANYRDLFPLAEGNKKVFNCEETGVLGMLPGMIGTLQAIETIKLLTGIGEPATNRLLTYNALTNQFHEFALVTRPDSIQDIPASIAEYENTDYQLMCSTGEKDELEIDLDEFIALLESKHPMVIDVREIDELPEVDEFRHFKIPVNQLKSQIDKLKNDHIVLFCKSGQRSLSGAKLLRELLGSEKQIFSLKENIADIKKQFKSVENG